MNSESRDFTLFATKLQEFKHQTTIFQQLGVSLILRDNVLNYPTKLNFFVKKKPTNLIQKGIEHLEGTIFLRFRYFLPTISVILLSQNVQAN